MIFLPRLYNNQDKDGQTPIMVRMYYFAKANILIKDWFHEISLKKILFQIAVKRQNVSAIKHLVSKEVDLARKDGKLNNVFHFTATTNKEIIEVNMSNLHIFFFIFERFFFSTWYYLYLDLGRESNLIKGTKRRRLYSIAYCMPWRYARLRPSISLCRSVNKRMNH